MGRASGRGGCTVIYGSEGFKCHSKIASLTYRGGWLSPALTLLGTGNFNEKTAKLYSDFMLMTAHPGIGEDANLFFRNLSLGNLRGDYRFLGVAPVGLKPLIMRGLDREIQRARWREPARVFFKAQLAHRPRGHRQDRRASCAGVRVDMIIRGISCLKARCSRQRPRTCMSAPSSGRFWSTPVFTLLAWIRTPVYLSSARHDDSATPSTAWRSPSRARPHLPRPGARVHGHAAAGQREGPQPHERRHLGPRWERAEGEKPFNSQEALLERAYRNAEAAAQQRAQEKERVAEEAIQAEVEHGAAAKSEAVATPR